MGFRVRETRGRKRDERWLRAWGCFVYTTNPTPSQTHTKQLKFQLTT